MQNIIKSGFKYFVFIGFFGVCINLIYLSIPVYMMIVYDRVLFSYSKATLYTLGVGVLVSLAVLGLIDYFRMRMLEQAGNNIAQKMMPFVMKNMQKNAATKGMNPQVYSRGIYDLEILRDAVVSGHIFYILDLPWVLIFLGVLYLMHPLVGGIAIAGVGIVFLFQLLLRALEKKRYIIADTAFHNNADFAHTCLQHGELISGMGMQSAVMEKYENRYTKNLTTKAGADIFQSGMGTMIRLFHLVSMAAVFGAGSFVFFTD
ncbi:MAG: hypothetical protein MI799_14055 [Desulfobacterales bacterium]|nr:hypothetical protein [Desulfobacterales bacterium]